MKNSSPKPPLKIALVHDWLIHMRGGERVLEAFAEIYPEATIYTLFSNRSRLSLSLQRMKIKDSLLQYFPGIRSVYRWLLPLLPFFIRTLQIEDCDLVISSSHCVAKAVRIPKRAIHICYCHTPMRYLWGFEEEYFGKFPEWLKILLVPIFSWLRRWDVETSRNVNHFLCNSETVQQRIQKIYGREAKIVYPPVETQFFKTISETERERQDYYLIVSALTPYKKIEITIEAFNDWNRKLWIAGDGPLRHSYARLIRDSNIRLLGRVSNQELVCLYSKAKALIFPQEEDFGIVALEAQACGTPVIAFARGGALETIRDGIFFDEQTPESIREAVQRFETSSFSHERLRDQALRFDKQEFKHKIRQAIEDVRNGWK